MYYAWDKNVTAVIMTVDNPRYLQRAHDVARQCEHVGIWPVHISVNTPAHDGSGVLKSIHRNHRNVCIRYGNPNKHLLIMEDDCEFLDPNAGSKILEMLQMMRFLEWTILYPGHIPLGPLLPTGIQGLARTTFPAEAHSYIVHGKKVGELINGRKEWGRPWTIEGWLDVSVMEKFAMVPPLTTQSAVPKELLQIYPNAKHVEPFEAAAHSVWIYIVPMVLIGLIIYKVAVKSR